MNLVTFTFVGEIHVIEARLGRVRRQLEKDNGTNEGGRFEWIDSILVKALQDGHWLLIDNVNFCRFNKHTWLLFLC